MQHISDRLNGQANVVMMHGFLGQAAQSNAKLVLKSWPNTPNSDARRPDSGMGPGQGPYLMENWIQSLGPKVNAASPKMMRWVLAH
jgi:inositol transport system substrate-binding protein